MKRLVRFWKEYARRYRWWYLLGILCLVATNVLTVAIPTFVQYAIDALDAGLGFDGAAKWALIILLAGLCIIVVRTLSRTLFFNPGRTVEFRVKSSLFDHLLELPRRFFDRTRAGDIISRGTNDANAMRGLIGFASLQLFNSIFTLALTLGRMFSMDVILTLWVAVPLIASGFVLRYGIVKMFALFGANLAQTSTLSERILESYSGVAVLQAYNALPGAHRRFDVENAELLDIGERLLRIREWLLPVVPMVGKLCVVLVLYIGGRMVVDGALTIGQLTAFVAYVNIMVAGLFSFGFLIGATQRGYIALGRIYELIDAPVERPETTAALPPPAPQGHGLRIRDLTFTHHGADRPALSGLDFEVEPGETLGIFGLTGSGKSTLLGLLARIHDPPPGTVTLDGVDIRDVPVRDYWRRVACVGQEAFLFSRSIEENIALADPPGEVDRARLRQAVADAALDVDVDAFPEGLATTVGERGITLSGGQRQRTALARAFYRDFEVLLLDDVMSAVDHATEKRLIDALYRRAARKTTLVVSHRISVLTKADRILVLDDGRLIGQGSHEELLEAAEPYARAWRLQQAAERAEALDEAEAAARGDGEAADG